MKSAQLLALIAKSDKAISYPIGNDLSVNQGYHRTKSGQDSGEGAESSFLT
jgi:hypothetical protein